MVTNTKRVDRWAEIEKGMRESRVVSIEVLGSEEQAAAASNRPTAADGRAGTPKSSARPTSRREHKPHAKGPARAAMAPEELRRVRKALKLTQAQFAEQLGVQPLTIGLWEGGKTPIAKGRALAIRALAAGLSIRPRRRSEAARKAWATRRRQEAARKAWTTRRKKGTRGAPDSNMGRG